jgi:hypothetical protein
LCFRLQFRNFNEENKIKERDFRINLVNKGFLRRAGSLFSGAGTLFSGLNSVGRAYFRVEDRV